MSIIFDDFAGCTRIDVLINIDDPLEFDYGSVLPFRSSGPERIHLVVAALGNTEPGENKKPVDTRSLLRQTKWKFVSFLESRRRAAAARRARAPRP